MSEGMSGQLVVSDDMQPPHAGVCPMHSLQVEPRSVVEGDELTCPHHRRMVGEYLTGDSGNREYHIHYGEKDITFDDPRLFAFGEELTKHERFMGRDATAWGPGYNWEQVRELLEQLLGEGILRRVDVEDVKESDHGSMRSEARPSPLPPAQTHAARTWHDCETIIHELTGRPLEVGYLESIIPIYRVAHIALDTEGRQVGEANVFPAQLRLDVPTEWRTCMYKGSRFQDQHPINVTALKSMKAHWIPILVAVKRIREAYLQRFPGARQGWTVGDLERLSALVLTLPAFLLMRTDRRVKNGDLHPILSSMFRVTDGVRMAMHYMLFVDVNEPTRPPSAPMTSQEIYAYAERNAVFLSDHGVCAGPRVMIEEFLRVLVDGAPVEGEESVALDEAVESALADIEPAFDYALYGLQVHAVTFVLWNVIASAYERLWAIVERWSSVKSEVFNRFGRHVHDAVSFMRTHTYLGTERSRVNRECVFKDMYERSASGLGSKAIQSTLDEHLTPRSLPNHFEVTEQLRSLFHQRICPVTEAEGRMLEELVTCLMEYFRREQAMLRAVSQIQQRINDLLGRPVPTRPLTGWDLYIYYRLQEAVQRPPYLLEDLKNGLGVQVSITIDAMDITDTMTSQ